MKIHHCEQLSPEWFELKRGISSASSADKILTPGGKLSAQSEGYLNCLLAEKAGYGDEPMEPTEWMQRGLELEPEARAVFEVETDLKVYQTGWITNNEGTAGCSPDGMVDRGGLEFQTGWEVKCPKASTHFGYLRGGILPPYYKPQVHMSMAVTGLNEWYFMTYYPGLKPLIVLVERNEYTDKVVVALAEFIQLLAEESKRFGL